jgi:Do/DeqQ family serine protease
MRSSVNFATFATVILASVAAFGALPAEAQTIPENRVEIQLSFAPVVRKAAPAVVNIYAHQALPRQQSPFFDDPFFRRFFDGRPFGMPRNRMRSSLGSGVVVDESGIIVTNDHVVKAATDVKVAFADGREYAADILIQDDSTDLAVLRLRDVDERFEALEFADSDDIEVGDLVLAIGNPFGVGQTVTSGIVSAVARTDIGVSDLSFFIQTDAAINPGNSGGPLVDMRGDIIGLNSAIFSRSGGSHGIGFAIPSNMVRSVVGQALAGSTEVERPWIGATFQRVTADIAESLGLDRPRGALVVTVERNSPADAAGLKRGDLVLRVNDRPISNPAALEYRLAVLGIGQQARFTILRRGRRFEVTMPLTRAPETVRPDRTLIDGPSPLAGAVVANLSPRLARRVGLPTDREGVVVLDVEPRTAAARLRLQAGDVILSVQGRSISSVDVLEEQVSRQRRLWRLTIDRKGRISNIIISG